MNETNIKELMSISIKLLNMIDTEVTKSLSQNEQFVLDFYDQLNEISVRK